MTNTATRVEEPDLLPIINQQETVMKPVQLHPFELPPLVKALSAEAAGQRRSDEHEVADLRDARAARIERIAQ
jgi:hypothetical protein